MPATDWTKVGRRVRRLRKQRELSQGQIAGRRISVSALSMIEGGKRKPSPDVLSYLAHRLGTTEDYLLTGRDPGIETRLRLDTERVRLAVHQGVPDSVLPQLDEIIDSARRSDLSAVVASALEVKGAAFQKLSRFEEAIECYDAAGDLWASSPVEMQVRARAGRARCLFLMGDVHYAVHVLEVLLSELRSRPAPDPNSLAQVCSALVGPYFKSGFADKARQAAEEAHRLAPRVSEPEVIGCMHINLAGVYLGDGLVEEAMRVLTRAEQSFSQLEWYDEVATTCIAQAMGLLDKEEWSEARRHLLRALDTLRRMPDPTTKATALNQLGRAERELSNLDDAERHLHEALQLVIDGNLNERGLAQRELGLCAHARGENDEARRFLLAAVDAYRAASNLIQAGLTYKMLGNLEGEIGDSDARTEFYLQGLEAATAAASGA